MEHINLTLQIEDVDEKDYSFWAVAVTDGGLRNRNFSVTMDGWVLDDFWKNPVLLLGHNYDALPLGKVADIEIKSTRMRFKPVFAVGVNPQADIIYRLYTHPQRFMRAFSVGFEPLEWVEDDKGNMQITKKALLEISAVPIGADPNALKEALCHACKCGVISNHQRRELWRLTRSNRGLTQADISEQSLVQIIEDYDTYLAGMERLEELLTGGKK